MSDTTAVDKIGALDPRFRSTPPLTTTGEVRPAMVPGNYEAWQHIAFTAFERLRA